VTEDLRSLLGDDIPEPELARLRETDALLRSISGPPEVPASLTAAVRAIPGRRRGSRVRLGVALAFAAALAAAAFGIGTWVGGGSSLEAGEQVVLEPTPQAPPDAQMVIDVYSVDEAGNWKMSADVTGLPPLPEGGYYEVWMTKGDTLASPCGRFAVDQQGQAHRVWLNGPYQFDQYDRWVVVRVLPGQAPSRWLLDGPVSRAA
jgi:anti-sigma-K factor RskA